MIAKLKKWLKAHNISSHTIASVVSLAALSYVGDDSVKNAVNGFLGAHPRVIALLLAAATIYLRYSASTKPPVASS